MNLYENLKKRNSVALQSLANNPNKPNNERLTARRILMNRRSMASSVWKQYMRNKQPRILHMIGKRQKSVRESSKRKRENYNRNNPNKPGRPLNNFPLRRRTRQEQIERFGNKYKYPNWRWY